MKMRSNTPMWIAKVGYIVMSLVFCCIGLCLICAPEASAPWVVRVMGISLIVFGGIKMVGYFSKDLYRLAFQYDLEFGILLVVLGLVLLIRPQNSMSFLLVAVGIASFIDALFKLRIASDSKQFGIHSWWMILVLAIATGVIACMLVFRPSQSASFLAVLLGIAILFEGILNLVVALSTVKIVENQYPDVIEGEYQEMEDDRK